MNDSPHHPSSADPSPTSSASHTHPSPPAHAFFDPKRLSPRSRAHSVASSIDSSGASSFSRWVEESPSTSAHTRPSLDFPTASLKPGHGVDGFLVDVPGAGQWAVTWTELIDLLMSPQTHATLTPNSLVAELATYVSSRFEQQPVRYQYTTQSRPSTAVSSLGANLHDLSFAAEVSASGHPFAPYAPEAGGSGTASFGYVAVNGLVHQAHPYPQEPPSIAPLQTVGQPFLSPINTELPVPPPHFMTTHPTPTSSSGTIPQRPSLQHGGRRPSSLRSGSPGRPSSIRSDSASSHRMHLRQASSPYPRPAYLHTAHLSTSSLVDFSGGAGPSAHVEYDEREPGTALPPEMAGHRGAAGAGGGGSGSKASKRGGLRPLNRETETYLWNPRKGQLSRVPQGVDPDELASYQVGGGEVIIFPAGSYRKVIVDDLEILPSDSRQRVNDWLRGQACVEGCAFRFEGKRPSVIRAHVVACKSRAVTLRTDPLKRLCQLQLDAQTLDSRMRANAKAIIPPPPLRSPPSAHESGDDHASDRRSIVSFDGVDSYAYSASSQASIYEQGGESYDTNGQGWEPQYAPAEQAAQGFVSSSSASVLSAGSSSLGLEGMSVPAHAPQEPWLASYGLSVPTGSSSASASSASRPHEQNQHHQRASTSAQSFQTQSTGPSASSFLSFDD
ncbi:hypothetical protein JCM10450v2_005575 [Rhodotorula kratochvilovae]